MLIVPLAGCIQFGGDEPTSEPEPPGVRNYSSLPAEFGGNVTVTAGVDVQPGTYLVEAVLPSCEWVKGVDGDVVASGQNDVVLDEGETVQVSGCSIFVRAD